MSDNAGQPLRLLHKFPCGDYEEDFYWFIQKASFGSYKAPPMLEGSQKELVERLALDEPWSSQKTYHETLASALPVAPPFPTPQPWLDQAVHPKLTMIPIALSDCARQPYAHYENQFQRPKAEFSDLIHDAFLHCWRNWSGQEFVRLTEVSLVNDEVYNSLELTAALTFTLASWSAILG